jgi:hypothetical protein
VEFSLTLRSGDTEGEQGHDPTKSLKPLKSIRKRARATLERRHCQPLAPVPLQRLSLTIGSNARTHHFIILAPVESTQLIAGTRGDKEQRRRLLGCVLFARRHSE